MPPRIEAKAKPDILLWARETAGFPREQAAARLKLPAERLASWESGGARPTINQLRQLATIYKRPLAVFFLPSPPPTVGPLHDFRRLPGWDDEQMSPALLAEMRRARRRRKLALELSQDLEVARPSLDLRARTTDDPDSIARHARELLGVSISQQETWREPYTALRQWSSILERRGVLVFQTGAVKLKEMRGFSISDRPYPAIVLNAKDKPRGRIFTLMHELTHLLLNFGGVCDPLRTSRLGRTPDERVEAFCNRVAGSILVPASDLVNDATVAGAARSKRWSDEEIKRLAIRFGVSREVILRRLVLVGKAEESFYEEQRRLLLVQYDQQKMKAGAKPIVRPDRKAVRDNGHQFTGLVLDAFGKERITAADVSDYLGVKLTHLDRITDIVRGSVEAP